MSIFNKFLLYAVLSLMLASCSIKEDRMECPCYVSVQTETDSDCLVTFFDTDSIIMERKVIDAESLCSGNNWTKLRKGDFLLSVVKDMDGMELSGGRILSCRKRSESSPVYCFSGRKTAVDDEVLVKGTVQKQHAVLNLSFVCTEQVYPYDLTVSSTYNALDLITLAGCRGEFSISPVIAQDKTTSFIMTRQNAAEPINLNLLDRKDGSLVSVIDLNTYIAATGYSWSAEYLGDINIVIDFAQASLSIQIEDWDEVIVFKLEI